MAGFDRSEWIDRPPEAVWSSFVDTANATAWMPDIVTLEKVTEGPVGLGTKYRETRRIGRKTPTTTLEVTAFEEGRRYAGTVDEMGVRGTYTYTFHREGDGTRVDLKAEVTSGALMKLMLPIIVGTMKKQDGEQLARLKRAIESG